MVVFLGKIEGLMEEGFQMMVQFKSLLSEVPQLVSAMYAMIRPFMVKGVLVMTGGALGALSRYGVGLFTARTWGTHFPWGTLLVNLTGCFLIGLVFGLAERVRMITPEFRLFFITGYLGALTTFSSFALETVTAGRAGMPLQVFFNIIVNNLGGITLTFMGMWFSRLK
jgi:CrcB protein